MSIWFWILFRSLNLIIGFFNVAEMFTEDKNGNIIITYRLLEI